MGLLLVTPNCSVEVSFSETSPSSPKARKGQGWLGSAAIEARLSTMRAHYLSRNGLSNIPFPATQCFGRFKVSHLSRGACGTDCYFYLQEERSRRCSKHHCGSVFYRRDCLPPVVNGCSMLRLRRYSISSAAERKDARLIAEVAPKTETKHTLYQLFAACGQSSPGGDSRFFKMIGISAGGSVGDVHV